MLSKGDLFIVNTSLFNRFLIMAMPQEKTPLQRLLKFGANGDPYTRFNSILKLVRSHFAQEFKKTNLRDYDVTLRKQFTSYQ